MNKAIVLDKNFECDDSEMLLPSGYARVSEHNLYIYVKSYLCSLRVNSAHAKNRGQVSGGGKKPWAQKGGGRARAGSMTSPVFVGGGVAHGPSKRNYIVKVNKKQKRLALEYALIQKAQLGKLFVVDSIAVESGKTRDAYGKFKNLSAKNALLVGFVNDEKTLLAYRNLDQCCIVDLCELNAYLITAYSCVVIEKSAFNDIFRISNHK
ncbi:MAG: 50S ribosomal protein L4 [Helicobacter sp.]|uniref:50S ribosomal protein L4 n=1 Tax=Helicobacter sp. 10-6591 TaxID=2004998 RepID=UPI000DCC7AA1|nr:50S ribosomal protein L4 [Helicobacter sp. 10-6591]MCI6217341.1 50S ribosomal protein L4 [Helicobacter sp.]MCI7485194.1 50S ribosomal protein L4 [Helicobacter sp.]MDD7567519.1 50S ribosomal protein L4 [Helicobacter sp.]MDY5741043.1 50S ribosomal protein L4 [Helicobacter sp.]RAX54350.1 50S ribosomal protein L4 [Helicobacter sp. 10-6591]